LKYRTISELLFWLSVILVLISGVFPDLQWLNKVFKPLLMPFLALYFFSFKEFAFKKSVFAALFFSWLGDLFLMFQHKNELFFIVGLFSFLIAHVWYIIAFSASINQYYLLKQKPWLLAIVFIYEVIFLYLLYPTLNDLLIPVVLYATVICLMFIFAMLRFKNVPKQSFWVTLLGALLFVLSDSTIAINKFLYPFALAYPVIIALYAIGQYLIIKGLVREN